MSEIMIYYAENNQQFGPVTLAQLAALNLTPDTLVWYVGLADWQPAGQAPLTMGLFAQQPPAINRPEPVAPPQEPVQPQSPQYPRYEQPYQQPQQSYQQPANVYANQTDNLYDNTQCPPVNLVWAIWGMIMFLPVGIPALINATRVRPLWNSARYDEAWHASAMAKRLGRTAITVGAIIIGVIFAIYFTLILLILSL